MLPEGKLPTGNDRWAKRPTTHATHYSILELSPFSPEKGPGVEGAFHTTMHTIQNTLYIMTQQAYVRLENATVRIDVEKVKKLQVPLHHLGGLVCFGNVMLSPSLMHRLADEGKSLVLLDQNGRFKARLEGSVSRNILLRKAQYKAARLYSQPSNSGKSPEPSSQAKESGIAGRWICVAHGRPMIPQRWNSSLLLRKASRMDWVI